MKITFEDYKLIPKINASLLKLVDQAESLEHLEALKLEQDSRTKSDWFTLGEAIHRAILEPERPQAIEEPTFNNRTNEGKAAKLAFLASLDPDQQSLGSDMFDRYKTILGRFKELKVNTAHWLTEITLEDDTYKGRLDAYDPSTNTIIDVKTTSAKLTDFPSIITKYRYDLQIGLYGHLTKQSYPGHPNPLGFQFIVLQTVQPYAVKVFEMDPYWFDHGMNQVVALTEKLGTLPASLHGSVESLSWTP
jgi:hypothetical protein